LITFLLPLLSLFPVQDFDIVGPGFVSYADPGVLEAVAERRVTNGWGLSGDWEGYDVLAAPASCKLLNRSGWLVAGGKVLTVKIVDCEQKAHAGQMAERGLLLDVNRWGLRGEKGWLVLK
jgi:hypothetical protein